MRTPSVSPSYTAKGCSKGVAESWPLHDIVMDEARLSHLPFWGPSEAVVFLIKRPSG